MTKLEQNYLIEQRCEDSIKEHGGVDKAIAFLEEELNGFESAWSSYSCDCLGHGITCVTLMISWLKRKYNKK